MPVSLPHDYNPAAFRAVRTASARQASAIERLFGWLKAAEQRRAERLLVQSICAAGIWDLSSHRN